MAGQKKSPASSTAPLTASRNTQKNRLTAYVSVRSLGGVNLFSGLAKLTAGTVEEYFSEDRAIYSACRRLQELGFEIERVSRLSIRISGPAKLFEKKIGLKFEKPVARGLGLLAAHMPFLPSLATAGNLFDTNIADVEGMVFPQPIRWHSTPAADPPTPAYHHLKVPEDVARMMNATPVHNSGNLGQNVRAAMIDTGFQWTHPYFTSRRYTTKVVLPEASDQDADGHGTAQSANFLAIAPQTFLYGLSSTDVVEPIQVARDDLKVQILSNSWGSGVDTDGVNGSWDGYWALVQSEIALCVKEGMVVLFSAGNGDMSFTASMPETISVGGVYADEKKKLTASDYASSWRSTRFLGQKVPEVCGLTGLKPKAIYIVLPVPPASRVDRYYGGTGFPTADETTKTDGWAGLSGTSAACPMVAGVTALILSQNHGVELAEIRHRLSRCIDVTEGESAMHDKAGPGQDDATGHGLVDAQAALS